MSRVLGAIALVGVLALLSSSVSGSRNPCHKYRGGINKQVTCKRPWFPKELCSKCVLRPTIAGGHFDNCKRIYDLEEDSEDGQQCVEQLRMYAEMNADCDPARKKLLEDPYAPNNKEALDYFVYAMCEQCCDCIPFKAVPTEFEKAKEEKRLLRPYRGNCPAHAYYDICLVLPKIEWVVGPDTPWVPWETKPLCPMVTDWFNSEASQKWWMRSWVPTSEYMRKFFWKYFNTFKCNTDAVWTPCAELEYSQGRLGNTI